VGSNRTILGLIALLPAILVFGLSAWFLLKLSCFLQPCAREASGDGFKPETWIALGTLVVTAITSASTLWLACRQDG
jgi:hypothetical protein